MATTLLMITDLGTFKAYKLNFAPKQSRPGMESLKAFKLLEENDRYANTLTTRAGRSAQGNVNLQSAGNNSDGESHNMELELRKRVTRNISEHMNQLLSDPEVERCFFAAPSEINAQILNEIKPIARQKIEKNIPRNLSRVREDEILEHFGPL